MRYFSVTDGRTDGPTNKAILGVGWGPNMDCLAVRPFFSKNYLKTSIWAATIPERLTSE